MTVAALTEARKEIERGVSLVSPHRDDLVLEPSAAHVVAPDEQDAGVCCGDDYRDGTAPHTDW
ncbi:hypothetical protein GCM10010521_71820 [Streptomyces rameus]|uniref:Uncharacterized protein n=1 Tax=Streptomyces rameus TaxID=68261 RepID=A0ABP6HPE0_9ACTN